MPSFTVRLADGWRRAGDQFPLALVPIVLAVMQTDSIRQVLAYDGVHVGIKFGVPASVVTIWQFVDPPSTGVSVNAGLPLSLPFAVVVVPLVVLLRAGLSAGYFGAIAARLVGRDDDFATSVRAHFLPFLAVTVLPYLFVVPFALGAVGVGGVGGGGAILVAILVLAPLLLAVGYLLWATPYLLVLRETGLLAAARGSYRLAVDGGPYLSYTVGYAALVVLVSAVATAVVVNVPAVGLPVGIVGGGFLGLVLNVTTMRFVADVDPQSPSAGEWPDQHRSGGYSASA
ncbi:hypothetical protein [Haloarcula sp. 1CSR25-25]|uniref:hypothetical protein n=1 Tax=Haloarcula sp. 1CSR25-25 TaxID=2862545 RepID=UPI0028960FE5|nr:hypothetical protein [Haloarcula sp. 1CSR25-25]MDT3433859.1 hypothetical protein [Haloarcula sp. 1CSR25-25]